MEIDRPAGAGKIVEEPAADPAVEPAEPGRLAGTAKPVGVTRSLVEGRMVVEAGSPVEDVQATGHVPVVAAAAAGTGCCTPVAHIE